MTDHRIPGTLTHGSGQSITLAGSTADHGLWNDGYAGRPKPYFRPVCTSSDHCVSLFEPHDHVWHRRLWLTNVQGAYEAVTFLLQNGHRHIGLVGSLPHAYPSIDGRRAGYRQALYDHGIAETSFGDSDWQVDEASEATSALLGRHPQITALCASNDESAIGAMHAAQKLGRPLPDDLSIVGVDDVEHARHVVPPLTTMQVDEQTMGRLAVQLIAHRIEFPDAAIVTTVIRPRLIERQSVRVQIAATRSMSDEQA